MHKIADLSLPPGRGDKKVLRELAARHLGLEDSARLVKRAIQFGSGIAKLSNAEHFGANRKGQGTAEYDYRSSSCSRSSSGVS